MASFTVEGVLEVDTVDFWGWLEAAGKDVGCASSPQFSVDDDAILLGGDGRHSVDAAAFWNWLVNQQLPESLRCCEIAFGVPRFNADHIAVSFAAGSASDPRSWARPPACLLEWKQTAQREARV